MFDACYCVLFKCLRISVYSNWNRHRGYKLWNCFILSPILNRNFEFWTVYTTQYFDPIECRLHNCWRIISSPYMKCFRHNNTLAFIIHLLNEHSFHFIDAMEFHFNHSFLKWFSAGQAFFCHNLMTSLTIEREVFFFWNKYFICTCLFW